MFEATVRGGLLQQPQETNTEAFPTCQARRTGSMFIGRCRAGLNQDFCRRCPDAGRFSELPETCQGSSRGEKPESGSWRAQRQSQPPHTQAPRAPSRNRGHLSLTCLPPRPGALEGRGPACHLSLIMPRQQPRHLPRAKPLDTEVNKTRAQHRTRRKDGSKP